jgi:hypothetical protein
LPAICGVAVHDNKLIVDLRKIAAVKKMAPIGAIRLPQELVQDAVMPMMVVIIVPAPGTCD